MQPDLQRTRRTLTLRYGLFASAILLVFSFVVHEQVKRSQSAQLRMQVEQLASTAAAELDLLHHEYDELLRPDVPSWLRSNARKALKTLPATQDPDTQIHWYDDQLNELKLSGGFQPAGTMLPPAGSRDRRQWLHLANGLALWQPVHSRVTPNQAPELSGYVSVALASSSSEAELARLRQGLLIGALGAGLIALAGSQWLVAASLDPIRRQIECLIRFTADASHELRHPLTAIRALIGTIRHSGLLSASPAAMQRKLTQIDQSTERMGRLVDDLLLLSRADRAIDDGYAMAAVPLEELVEDLVELHAAEAEATGLHLQKQLEQGASVQGHPQRLRQLLENLLSNARRFSPPGGTVTVGLKRQGDLVQLWVDDQGPGIPASQREQIFERFWQADPARSGPDHAGLGLSIAQAIASAHGGQLRATEAPGGGCRMLLEFPIKA